MFRKHSDHAPILLRIKNLPSKGGAFKIEHWWFTREDFKSAWCTEWGLGSEKNWEQKYKAMRRRITSWSATVETPHREVQRLQQKIQNFQMQHPLQQSADEEKSLFQEYDKAEERWDMYWKQRFRIQWNTLGDRNTRFFHATATHRKRTNKILSVQNSMGRRVESEKEVSQVFVQYFKDLYRT
jgi:hypothetical protein